MGCGETGGKEHCEQSQALLQSARCGYVLLNLLYHDKFVLPLNVTVEAKLKFPFRLRR